MHRIVSLLLIPFCLIVAPPHSHYGGCAVEPDDHASRPHIHLSGGHAEKHASQSTHCTHEDANSQTLLGPLADHDSDVLYISELNTPIRRQSPSPLPHHAVWPGLSPIANFYSLNEADARIPRASPDVTEGFSHALLFASLRI